MHDPGEIETTNNWMRLDANITYYHVVVYLSMFECRPGWLAIWRELHAEMAAVVTEELEKVILK